MNEELEVSCGLESSSRKRLAQSIIHGDDLQQSVGYGPWFKSLDFAPTESPAQSPYPAIPDPKVRRGGGH
jgi:hypothetical protein